MNVDAPLPRLLCSAKIYISERKITRSNVNDNNISQRIEVKQLTILSRISTSLIL